MLLVFLIYLEPILDDLQIKEDSSLYDILDLDFRNLSGTFAAFIVFILITWIISFRVLIPKIMMRVKRARMGVKMIPAVVLMQIEAQKSQ